MTNKATQAKNSNKSKFQPWFLPSQSQHAHNHNPNPENKILGHSRPQTPLYGRTDAVGGQAQGQDVLVNRGNTSMARLSLAPSSLSSSSRTGTRMSIGIGPALMSGSSAVEDVQTDAANSTLEFFSSSTLDINTAAFENWLSILEVFPNPDLAVEPSDMNMNSLFEGSPPMSMSNDLFSPTPEFVTNPVLLGLGPPAPQDFGTIPPLHSLTSTSPMDTNYSMMGGPITPRPEEGGTFLDSNLERIIAQMDNHGIVAPMEMREGIFPGQGVTIWTLFYLFPTPISSLTHFSPDPVLISHTYLFSDSFLS